MTPPRRPRPSSPAPDDRPVVRVRDQGELVAAIPAMLGFHPRESLVLMATGGQSGRRLGLTLRVDLPPPEIAAYAEHAEVVAASAVRGLLLDDPAGAVAAVLAPSTGDPPSLPHRRLAGLVAQALAEREVDVHALLWAESTTGGARWACYEPCGCWGLVPDPAATEFVVATVAEGRVVHPDRDALERLVAPADPGALRRREELLLRSDAGGAPGDTGAAALDTAIADAAAGRLTLSDTRVVALASALGIPAVQAAALQRSTGPRAVAAEQLWAALARETPDPEAAVPAALLAVSALLRGDGALANVALGRAERAWPGHLLAGVLRTAAEAGLRPDEVREWLREGLTMEPAPAPRATRRGRRSA
ncbi:DUF4192 domain-containing protein [Pseudonocardia kunmingensis]|uniref:DUF4192 domain-containing protein n=1 Tax=Pseudonocardia kunmingensis TaxID=630975 RepID=UPI00114F6799|nr:DUF4192 domain-containing protein [Pseudonocardia kunmingensis]